MTNSLTTNIPITLGVRPGYSLTSSTSTTDTQRVVATLEIVGHASPRWEGAADNAAADRNNADLAERRAQSVKRSAEQHLRELLPSKQLEFDVNANMADPLQSPGDINVGTRSSGSQETLVEAGDRGRTANDRSMRRVDIGARLDYAIDTEVRETVNESVTVSGASRSWKMRILGETGIKAIGVLAGGGLELHNKRLNTSATYAFYGSGVGVAVGFKIIGTDLEWSDFSTPDRMSFRDFDFAQFSATSVGINLGIGYEFSRFRFEQFASGKRVPRDAISTSGFNAGGIELNLGEAVTGLLKLVTDNPRETRQIQVPRVNRENFRSTLREDQSHKVYFETGSDRIGGTEDAKLGAFLATIAQPFRE